MRAALFDHQAIPGQSLSIPHKFGLVQSMTGFNTFGSTLGPTRYA